MTELLLPRKRLDLTEPQIMGVINATPDSFSDGGRALAVNAAVALAQEHLEAGAAILDVGGESTRPGALPVSAEEEIRRVVPVIEAIATGWPEALVSIDTSKAEVAAAALAVGAQIINDVTALGDPQMAPLAAERGAGVVLMHMRGTPRTMQSQPIHYHDVVVEVRAALQEALTRGARAGIDMARMMIDPGIGFGKELTHNLVLTRRLHELADLGVPIVYGPSRKRFLGEVTGRDVHDRDRATAAACCAAVMAGAKVVRVHHVAAVIDAVRLGAALFKAGSN